jgi:putative addiction module killer protein
MAIAVRKTSVFRKWMNNLKDAIAKAHIGRRIERLANGNPGDAKPIGESVFELRIDHGPGYRVYYKYTGKELIIILCGGDKSSQHRDIEEAKRIAREEEEYDDENE